MTLDTEMESMHILIFQFMMVSGTMACKMVRELANIQMDQNTKANGKTVKNLVKVNIIMWTAVFLLECSKKTKNTVWGL